MVLGGVRRCWLCGGIGDRLFPVPKYRVYECSDVIRAVWGDNLLCFTLGIIARIMSGASLEGVGDRSNPSI